MYFKAIEMKGFKSFVDEIKLDFSPGVTSVVGPNGCGKSNIYDAIRWVLGEQSPKLLRGKKMEDLIFNGTQERKPHGMAEVSLVMGDLNGELPSEWGNFDEIRVTRRLFRDGESEYLINKIPCRLKDIVEVFLDTGVSSQAFCLIEQGQVGAIINSKPENRRSLIEEAAGIIKYKHKKEIALRKLEHSNQNLLRLNDIVSEITRQVNSLKRQARKAERYKEYQKKIHDQELSLFAKKYLLLKEEMGVYNSEFEKIRGEETELSAKNSSLENKIENIKFAIAEGEKELSGVKGKAFEIAAEADRVENRIERLKEQIEDIKSEKQRNDSEIDFLGKKLEEIEGEIGRFREEKESCLQEMESQERVIADQREELGRLDENIAREESLLNEKKAFHVETVSQVAQEKNQIGSLENKLENIYYARKRLEEELAGDQERYQDLEKSLDQLKKNNLLVSEKLEEISEERDTAAKDLEQARLEKESLEDKINDLQSELTAKTSRLKSLEELEINLEGYEGVRYLLRSENGSSQIQGIHGVVADLLETSQEYELALSAVLGEKLQSLVMENHENIEQAIDCLKSNEKGRGTFIPIKPKILHDNPVLLNGEKGVVGKALDLITYKDNYKGVLEFLLRDVVVVRDFSVALELYASKPPCTLVTLSGDVLEPSGVAVGGNVKGDANLQLLKKKRVMRELGKEIKQLDTELTEKKELKSEVCRQIEERTASLEEIEERQNEIERESLELGKDLQHLEEEYTRVKKRVDLFDFEKGKLSEEEEQINEKIGGIRENLVSLTEKERQGEAEIDRFQETLAGLHQERESFKSKLSEMTVVLASLNGKKENSSLKYDQVTEKMRDIEGRIEDLKDDSIKREERAKENLCLIDELEVSLKELFDEKRIIEESVTEKEEAVSEQKRDLESLETETKVLRKEIDELKEQLNEIEIRRTELETKMTSIRERVNQEYGLLMENLLQREEEEFSMEERERELRELKEKLSRLGDVNLTALEEYQNLDARLKFLNEQKEDLVQSIDALNDVIDKMNRKTKNLFKETFDAVNKSFQEIFPRLFEGGKGELVLTDEHNLLETGLEILVQPAGKRLQNITLLSAGEKALTAISLLFSIFLVKPGPFCLLDEVDAPLDESNIERFASILRELSQRTQFIIITHNKRTMSFADVLYGVTMEEEGISKVVSLQLNEKS